MSRWQGDPINYVDFFTGQGTGLQALDHVGIPISEQSTSAEVDKHALALLKKQYPNVKQLGDISKVHAVDLPGPIDLMVTTSPCTGFSRMNRNNKRAGDNPESVLALQVGRIIDELADKGNLPQHLFNENVAGSSPEEFKWLYDSINNPWYKATGKNLHVYRNELDSKNFGGINGEHVYFSSDELPVDKLEQYKHATPFDLTEFLEDGWKPAYPNISRILKSDGPSFYTTPKKDDNLERAIGKNRFASLVMRENPEGRYDINSLHSSRRTHNLEPGKRYDIRALTPEELERAMGLKSTRLFEDDEIPDDISIEDAARLYHELGLDSGMTIDSELGISRLPFDKVMLNAFNKNKTPKEILLKKQLENRIRRLGGTYAVSPLDFVLRHMFASRLPENEQWHNYVAREYTGKGKPMPSDERVKNIVGVLRGR